MKKPEPKINSVVNFIYLGAMYAGTVKEVNQRTVTIEFTLAGVTRTMKIHVESIL